MKSDCSKGYQIDGEVLRRTEVRQREQGDRFIGVVMVTGNRKKRRNATS